MNPRRLILLAAAVTALTPATAAAADHVYDVHFVGGGEYHHTWERAIDEDNVERRDTNLTFSWETKYEGVRFRDGRLVAPVEDSIPEADVTGTEVQHHRTSNGTTTQTCATELDGTDVGAGLFGHGLDLEGSQVVVRPAERLSGWLRCPGDGSASHMHYDMQSPAISSDWPIMGMAPLDAVFELPPEAIGAGKIIQRVGIGPHQTRPESCPQRDPDHTLACSITWSGEIEMVRRDPAKPTLRAFVDRGTRRVVLVVRCETACSGRAAIRMTDESDRRRTIARLPFRARPGQVTKITRRLDARAWRTVSRGGVSLDVRSL